jgi:hypothetical protein
VGEHINAWIFYLFIWAQRHTQLSNKLLRVSSSLVAGFRFGLRFRRPDLLPKRELRDK